MTPDPEMLALPDLGAAQLAAMIEGTLDGADTAVRHLRPASVGRPPAGSLGYGTGTYVDVLRQAGFSVAITLPEDRDRFGDRPVIVHSQPRQAFYWLHTQLARNGLYPILETRRGRARISPSAVVHEGTQIGDDVVIGDHVTVMPNSVLSDGVSVQAGSVVGEPGFQVADGQAGRYLVPHTGGVHLGRGVSIGANNCIDRALHSTFTTLGDETMLDNFVHVAHDVVIGKRCTLTAHVELSGVVTLEDDVWLAPRTCCNQFVRFGRGSYTGTGSVVVRDVPPFTLVKGNPARPGGNVCLCRSKIDPSNDDAMCQTCGRRYEVLSDGTVALLEVAWI